MADPIPLQSTQPPPVEDSPALPGDFEKFAEAVAEEIIRLEKKIPAAQEPLAPIVNVQSAVPAITVSPADNPAPIVNVETAAPVINVLPAPPALPPTFNFHADSAAVGFDMQTIVDELSLIFKAIYAGNDAVRSLQEGMLALAQSMDRQAAAIEAQGNAIDAMARALLAPRRIVTDPAGKPVGLEIKG